jgi:hypothetical protein
MTLVGKILVFVNLVFSLAVGGLIVVVYATRANWKDAYDKKDAQYKAANAERQQAFTEKEDAAKLADETRKRLEKQLADATTAREAVEKEKNAVAGELATLKQKERASGADVVAVQTSSGVRMVQVKELTGYLEAERQEKLKVIDQYNAARQDRIRAEVEAKDYKNRNLQLEEELRAVAKELARAKLGTSGSATVARKRGEDNPPSENVNGQIVGTDPTSDLVRISVGSDAGLTTGHTLKVFRLDPIPENSKYLGTIEILSVKPHEAVGRPVRRPAFPLKKGDRVATRIQVGG